MVSVRVLQQQIDDGTGKSSADQCVGCELGSVVSGAPPDLQCTVCAAGQYRNTYSSNVGETCSTCIPEDKFWIGLNDLNQEGTFKFTDETGFSSESYKNWNDGEPNDFSVGEDCVTINKRIDSSSLLHELLINMNEVENVVTLTTELIPNNKPTINIIPIRLVSCSVVNTVTLTWLVMETFSISTKR